MIKNHQEKLANLRNALKQKHVDAYIIPRADEYLGEFVPAYAQRLEWLTGFTGSAGAAIITQTHAIVMSDSRYDIQIRQEIDLDLFTPLNSIQYPLKDWLYDHMPQGAKVGFDPRLHAIKDAQDLIDRLTVKHITLTPLDSNLIDTLWQSQPAKPSNPIEPFPSDISGMSTRAKRHEVAQTLKAQGANVAIITKPDSISWLLNIRGQDLDYMPVPLCTAIIDARDNDSEPTVTLFTDCKDVPNLKAEPADALKPAIETLCRDAHTKLALDLLNCPYWYSLLATQCGADPILIKDPCIDLKAQKTYSEYTAIKQAHIIDGVAIVKLLHWLDTISESGQGAEIDECDVANKLDSFRREHPSYKSESFPAITGFAENGAIVHYRAKQGQAKRLKGDNLLLIDSGGQYFSAQDGEYFAGTTDITRTIAIGNAAKIPQEAKHNFTLVLKGHIALAMARFPKGTTGAQIDALARQPLQNEGLDYGHGTGHGVGCYGDVHEEAANISPRGRNPLQACMLLSNEPGYYKENAYGIRTESLVFVREHIAQDKQESLYFETVTLAPIDQRLIVKDLLNAEEKAWLNQYHQRVQEELTQYFQGNKPLTDWLKLATKPI